MKRPYDLMAFLEQEKRVEKLENLKTLLSDTSSLDNVADRHEPDLEEKFYNNDIDCQNAGQPLTEFDLFTSTLIHPDPSVIPEVVRILRDEYADLEKSELTQPLCGKVKPLHFELDVIDELSVSLSQCEKLRFFTTYHTDFYVKSISNICSPPTERRF